MSEFLDRWRSWLGPAGLTLACALAVVGFERRGPVGPGLHHTDTVPAQAHELLDGLQAGDAIAGWTVLGIDGPGEEGLRIDLGRDALRFSVTLSPLGAQVQGAPRSTERYAIYYGHAHPRGAEIPDGAVRAILAGVERRVRKHERDVVVPGL